MTIDSSEIKTVLIVGATGRLGRLLVEHFARTGWRVRALARHASNAGDLLTHSGIDIVQGDLTIPESIRPACEGCSLTIFAAGARRPAYAFDLQSEADFQRVNVAGLRELGRAVIQSGIAPLIHLSSLFALGLKQAGTLTEETVPCPSTPFEQSERQGEQELLKLHQSDGLDCRIMRLPPVAGAAPRGGLLDILRVAATDPAWIDEIERCATTYKPLISLGDFIAAVQRTLEFGSPGRTYHFSSGDFDLRRIVDTLRQVAVGDHSLREFMFSRPDRSDALTSFLAKYLRWSVRIPTCRASSELAWMPRGDTDHGGTSPSISASQVLRLVESGESQQRM